MPLAIEIAAKHLSEVPDLTFADYLGKIDNKVEILQLENDKNKNVRLSLELSLDQVKNMEKGDELLQLFEGASVCAKSGFTSETLIKTVGFDPFLDHCYQDLVAKLYRRSLLEFNNDTGRYNLHPLLRQIASESLQKDHNTKILFNSNHCNFFLNYCIAHQNDLLSLVYEKDGIWMALIQANFDENREETRQKFFQNLKKPYFKLICKEQYQKAFSYLVEINLLKINIIGEAQVLINLLKPLHENISKLNANSQIQILNMTGLAYTHICEYNKAIKFFEDSLKISQDVDDEYSEEMALGNIGIAYKNLGQFPMAISYYKKQLEIVNRIGDTRSLGNALENMGVAHKALGDYELAINLFKKSLDIFRILGDAHGQGVALMYMGLIYFGSGKVSQALELYKQALEMQQRIGDAGEEGNIHINMGLAYKELGNYELAIDHYNKAFEIHSRIGDIRNQGRTQGNLATIYMDLGDYPKSIELFGKALDKHDLAGDIQAEGNDLMNLGMLYIHLNDYEKGVNLLRQALEIHRQIRDLRAVGKDLTNLGIVFAENHKYPLAIDAFKEAQTINRAIGNTQNKTFASINLILAEYYIHKRDNDLALEYLNEANNIFDRLNIKTMDSEIKILRNQINSGDL